MQEIKEMIEKQFPGRLFLNLGEAAKLMGIARQTVYNYRARGKELPFRVQKLAGRKVVSIAEILRVASE